MTKCCPRADGVERLRKTVGRVSNAVDSMLGGRAVAIADGSARAAYLAFSGRHATTSTVAWAVRHGSGFICVPMLPDRARALNIPLISSMTDRFHWPHYGVSVDAASGITTGISAHDRARTIALLSDPASHASDFTRPGHVVVEYIAPDGVLARPRPSEGVIDLLRIAKLPPVGGLCAIVSERDPTALAAGEELRSFCDTHDTALISVGDLITFRELTEPKATGKGERHGGHPEQARLGPERTA
jgi:3,4-dihydroxy 2-butanone 4-phosphate synthase/GTP cyclohydrolase II